MTGEENRMRHQGSEGTLGLVKLPAFAEILPLIREFEPNATDCSRDRNCSEVFRCFKTFHVTVGLRLFS
jgi:hypothetical protein